MNTPIKKPADVTIAKNMRAAQAAQYVGLSKSTLAKLRMAQNRGKGPRYAKLGGSVIYRSDDLDRWVEQSSVS